MLIEEAERRGSVRLRALAACVLEHNLLLQIKLSARFSLLHSTDQTTFDEIVASVSACFTAAGKPDWLLLELSPQHPEWSSVLCTLSGAQSSAP